uniref:Uncharacterized protein n=1 Tax=Aegilops tauschii subsp. strangulata TaxID=200361 RepID=A0A453PQE7_AEGTS
AAYMRANTNVSAVCQAGNFVQNQTDAHVLLPVALPLVTHPSPASRAPNSITSRAHDAHAR